MSSYTFHLKKIVIMGLLLSLSGSVASCGASSAEIQTEHWELDESFEGTEVEIDVPKQIPGILTDQVGFEPSSDKALVFKGEKLPGKFYILDSESGETVYTGEIVKSSYNEELDEYDNLGYFSDLDKKGRYHAYSDALGESYDFSIRDGIYEELTDQACKMLFDAMKKEPGQRDVRKDSKVADALLMAYEMNEGAFSDDLGIPESGNGIPDIVDKARDEVKGLLSDDPYAEDTKSSAKDGLYFAAILAKISMVFRNLDADFSDDCLQKARNAWDFCHEQDAGDAGTDEFYAAAQLYRATGIAEYHDVLLRFFDRKDFRELFNSDDNVFMGSVSYLSIKGDTDLEICNMLMKALLQRAEEIADKASNSAYLVSDLGMDDGFEKMLSDMKCLTITDHVIYNHEYTTIIENHIHYLMGRNPKAVNFVTRDTEGSYEKAGEEGIMEDPEKDALLIFMLSILAGTGIDN